MPYVNFPPFRRFFFRTFQLKCRQSQSGTVVCVRNTNCLSTTFDPRGGATLGSLKTTPKVPTLSPASVEGDLTVGADRSKNRNVLSATRIAAVFSSKNAPHSRAKSDNAHECRADAQSVPILRRPSFTTIRAVPVRSFRMSDARTPGVDRRFAGHAALPAESAVSFSPCGRILK